MTAASQWPIPLNALIFYIGKDVQSVHRYCRNDGVIDKFDRICQPIARTIFDIIDYLNGTYQSKATLAGLCAHGASSLLAGLRLLREVISCKVANQFVSSSSSSSSTHWIDTILGPFQK